MSGRPSISIHDGAIIGACCSDLRTTRDTCNALGFKMARAHAGKHYTLGKKHSPEANAKKSAAMRGNKRALGASPSDETRAKMSAAHAGNEYAKGTKHSVESRALRSEFMKRVWEKRAGLQDH